MTTNIRAEDAPFFIIQVPANQFDAAAQALSLLGIDLEEGSQMVAIDHGAQFKLNGRTCRIPVSFGDDLPDMVRAVNVYLDSKGLTPRLPDQLDLQRRYDCLSLVNAQFSWDGLSLQTGGMMEPEHHADWDAVVLSHPRLFDGH